jgi:hypothetical protein
MNYEQKALKKKFEDAKDGIRATQRDLKAALELQLDVNKAIVGQKAANKLNLIDIVHAVMVITDRDAMKMGDKDLVKSVDDAFFKKIASFDEKDTITKQ